MRTNNCLGLMAVVAFSSGNALALCTTSVEGTSGANAIALCMRYDDGEDRVWAAKCTSGSLSWIDVCDSYGTLTGNVTIAGLEGNDTLITIDAYFDSDFEGCAIECFGEIDLDTYSVTLNGGVGNDVLSTANETGPVFLNGGDNNDYVLADGNYSGNILHGDEGIDVVADNAGTADSLYGDAANDCLQHGCPGAGEMDCGSHTTGGDSVAWSGVAVCCPGPELCKVPVNCENYVGSCL